MDVRRELRLLTGAGQMFASPFPIQWKTVEAVPFPHVTWAHAWPSYAEASWPWTDGPPLSLCQSMLSPSASTPPIDLRRPTTVRTKRRTSPVITLVLPSSMNLSPAVPPCPHASALILHHVNSEAAVADPVAHHRHRQHQVADPLAVVVSLLLHHRPSAIE